MACGKRVWGLSVSLLCIWWGACAWRWAGRGCCGLERRGDAEGVHLGEDLGGFVFEGVTLAVVVVFGELAGAELEVEVAEVVVDDVFTLAEVVEAGLLVDRDEGVALRPEDVRTGGEQEDDAGEKGLEAPSRSFLPKQDIFE